TRLSSTETLPSLAACRKTEAAGLPLLEKCFDLRKARLGADHPDLIVPMNNLASAYRADGKLDRALPLFQEVALAVEKGRFEHVEAYGMIVNLVDCYTQLKQPDQAEMWRRKWLAVVKGRSGADSAAYARELASLGEMLLSQQKWKEAETVFRDALSIRE